jgi:hypothetical protein
MEDEDLSWLDNLPEGSFKELPKDEVPEVLYWHMMLLFH